MNPISPGHVISGWRFRTLIISIFAGVICYFIFSLWGGWEEVIEAFKEVSWKGISIALMLSFFSYYMKFIRWNYYMHKFGYNIPYLPHLRIYFSGFSLSTTPGKTGESIRNLFLHDYGVGYHQSFGAFFAERFSDLLSVISICLFSMVFYEGTYTLVTIISIIIMFILVAVQRDDWMKSFEQFVNRILPKRFSSLVDFGIETILSFRTCFRPGALLYGAILGIIGCGLQGCVLQYILHVLGVDLPFFTVQFIFAFSLLVGAIVLLPGGLGGTELMMLQLLLVNGVVPSIAVAATLLVRLTTIWFSVALGLCALPFEKLVIKD